jgi:hypothetical protein
MSSIHLPSKTKVGREFYEMVLGLGKIAKQNYLAETRRGDRMPNFTELRELEENIKTIEAELEKYK